MTNHQQSGDTTKSNSIQLTPKYHPKKVEISRLENGFTIELRGGDDLDFSSRFKKALVARTQTEVLKLAEEFLQD